MASCFGATVIGLCLTVPKTLDRGDKCVNQKKSHSLEVTYKNGKKVYSCFERDSDTESLHSVPLEVCGK